MDDRAISYKRLSIIRTAIIRESTVYPVMRFLRGRESKRGYISVSFIPCARARSDLNSNKENAPKGFERYIERLVYIDMGRAKSLYSLEEQRLIVEEAYSAPNNIKPTARKYRFQPIQIRKYKEKLERCSTMDETKYRIIYPQRVRSAEKEGFFEHLKTLIIDLRDRQQAVSIGFLMREARRFGEADFVTD